MITSKVRHQRSKTAPSCGPDGFSDDKVGGGREKKGNTSHLVSRSNDLGLDPEVPRWAVRRKEGHRADVGLIQAISFDDVAVVGREGPTRGAR